MKIDVILTKKAFVRFTRFDILRRRKMWRAPVIFASILGASGAICFMNLQVEGAGTLGSVLLLIGLGLPIVYFSDFASSLRKHIKVAGLDQPQHVYSLELRNADRKGIHIYNKKEDAGYNWKSVYHVYRDTNATYLYMTPARAFLMPDECLEDTTPEELWAFLCEVLPEEKRTVLKRSII